MSNGPNAGYTCISHIATTQGGYITTSQLHAAGVTRGAIEHWVRTARLHRAYHGVYAVGHIPTHPESRAFGAQLAVGDHGALAGRSAGAFYGVYRSWKEPFELITSQDRRPSGLIIHHSRTLLLRDIWRHQGLRVTSPARTALDITAPMTTRQRKRAVDHLRLRHKLKLHEVVDVIARNPRHPGAEALRDLLSMSGKRPSRSDFEREVPAFVRRFNLPACELNAMVGEYEVDVLFLPARLIVELDTFETHLLNFHSDRQRDAEILARLGIPTIRLTWEAFRAEPAHQAELILATLARR
jgi:very-short-patch-repair endonuclease